MPKRRGGFAPIWRKSPTPQGSALVQVASYRCRRGSQVAHHRWIVATGKHPGRDRIRTFREKGSKGGNSMRNLMIGTALVALVATSAPAFAGGGQARASKTQRTQEQMMMDVPHCTRKLGTVSVMDGDDPSGWTQFQLAGPQKLLKVLIQRSGCFNLVDRGSGLSAAQRERDIGGDLGLQRRSNVGQGQIKAADYVLVAEVQAANRNSGGSAIGAGIGGLVGGRFGGLVGGIGSKKMEANTVLSL